MIIIVTITTALMLGILFACIVFIRYIKKNTSTNQPIYPEIGLSENEKLDKDENMLPPDVLAKLLIDKREEFNKKLAICAKAGICPLCGEKTTIESNFSRQMAVCSKGHFRHTLHYGDYGYIPCSARTEL